MLSLAIGLSPELDNDCEEVDNESMSIVSFVSLSCLFCVQGCVQVIVDCGVSEFGKHSLDC